MYEAVPSLELVDVPPALDRRPVERWVVRDHLHAAAVTASDVGTGAALVAGDRGATLRELADSRRACVTNEAARDSPVDSQLV